MQTHRCQHQNPQLRIGEKQWMSGLMVYSQQQEVPRNALTLLPHPSTAQRELVPCSRPSCNSNTWQPTCRSAKLEGPRCHLPPPSNMTSAHTLRCTHVTCRADHIVAHIRGCAFSSSCGAQHTRVVILLMDDSEAQKHSRAAVGWRIPVECRHQPMHFARSKGHQCPCPACIVCCPGAHLQIVWADSA